MMSNNQIYLSKSNRANPDHVMMVRRHLQSLGYEILEHQGGEYNESLLYKSRYMVMVGIEPPSINRDGKVKIGKGQYNQLLNRRNRNTNYYNLYFSHSDSDDTPVYKSVINLKVLDEDNWTDGYGLLKVKLSSIRTLPDVSKRIKPEPAVGEDYIVDDNTDNSKIEVGKQFHEDADTTIIVSKKAVHLACITLLT